MLTALHHITLATHDLDAAIQGYTKLFGHASTIRGECAWFQLGNILLKLQQDHQVEGIASLTFATPDLAKTRHVLQRRGINLADVTVDQPGLALDRGATFGVLIHVIESSALTTTTQTAPAVVNGLDHVVITTSHPERAAALYGARLGLEMKLDRTNPDWGSRLMFFKCGDSIVEIAHSLKNADPAALDHAWGLSWRVADIAAANARLKNNGFNVSDVRTGRKPETQVFTVRDAPASVPTIVIGYAS